MDLSIPDRKPVSVNKLMLQTVLLVLFVVSEFVSNGLEDTLLWVAWINLDDVFVAEGSAMNTAFDRADVNVNVVLVIERFFEVVEMLYDERMNFRNSRLKVFVIAVFDRSSNGDLHTLILAKFLLEGRRHSTFAECLLLVTTLVH